MRPVDITIGLLGVVLLAGCGDSASEQAQHQSAALAAADEIVRLDCTPVTHPQITIRGHDVSRYPNGLPAGFRGFADPCVRHDPDASVLWLAYSWPHMQHMGGDRRDFVVGVETHLASSDDGGKTWRHVKALWPRTPASYTNRDTKRKQQGFISHEVPNIVRCEIDGKPRWVGARLDYFLGRKGSYKARDNRSFVLRIMAAATPPQLTDAQPVTFGHAMSSPDAQVDINLTTLSRDFPAAFIPNEPALHWRDGRLYLTFVCMTFARAGQPDFAKSFIPVFSTQPKGDVGDWDWRYHGQLAARREANDLGGEALTQIELATARDGQLLALLTPETWDAGKAREFGGDAFGGILHHECVVVEVASLDKPALARRSDGLLAVRAVLHSSTQSDHGPGAAGYDSHSVTGVLFTLRHMRLGGRLKDLSWTLHPTGLHP